MSGDRVAVLHNLCVDYRGVIKALRITIEKQEAQLAILRSEKRELTERVTPGAENSGRNQMSESTQKLSILCAVLQHVPTSLIERVKKFELKWESVYADGNVEALLPVVKVEFK